MCSTSWSKNLNKKYTCSVLFDSELRIFEANKTLKVWKISPKIIWHCTWYQKDDNTTSWTWAFGPIWSKKKSYHAIPWSISQYMCTTVITTKPWLHFWHLRQMRLPQLSKKKPKRPWHQSPKWSPCIISYLIEHALDGSRNPCIVWKI